MNPQTVLVTGATGNAGHHVVAGLQDAGVTVCALSRDPLSSRLPAGVATLSGDLTDPGSLRHASAGADAAFLLWPFPAAQGAEAAVGALAGQVRRIVYLSAMSVRDGAPPADNGVWGQVEQAIRQSGAEWTFPAGRWLRHQHAGVGGSDPFPSGGPLALRRSGQVAHPRARYRRRRGAGPDG